MEEMTWLGWVVLMVAAYLLWWRFREANALPQTEVRAPDTEESSRRRLVIDEGSPIEVELAHQWESGNYDVARAILQKFAYGMVGPGVSEDDKARFRTLMTGFALDDPLYREVMGKLKPIVLAHPGILQSSIYPYLPEYDQETVRYVAYFGHEIGDIHRRKKGRSYELLPPGVVIDMPD